MMTSDVAVTRGPEMFACSLTATRRSLLAGFTALLLAAAAPAHADAEEGARLFIEGLAAETVAIAADPAMDATGRQDRLRALLERGFDTDVIGRFVLGRYWQDATDTQRHDFIALFRDFTVASYARRFEGYEGQRLEILNIRNQGGAEDRQKVMVGSRMLRPAGDPVRIDWRVRQAEDGWRIYDVVVEGISMVLTQRSEIAAVLQRSGGNIDGLLEQLRANTARLESAGKAS